MIGFSGKDLYQLKVTLIDSKPPIWRRIVVPKAIALDELHMVIQLAMGWTNSHLYLFEKGNLRYGIQLEDDEFLPSDIKSDEGIPLKMLLHKENDKILYEYDFGDAWRHTILLEKASLSETDWPQIPMCMKGKGTCPIEDSGGIWGYYQTLQNASDVNYSERKDLHDWLMQDINEREYDLNAINARLADLYA